MATFNDSARPRFYALDADYRIEVTRTAGEIAPIDVIDADGESCDADDLLALACDLCSYEGEDVEEALDALLGYALDLDAAERRVSLADDADLDAAIPYTLGPSEWPIEFVLTDAANAALDELVEWTPDESPDADPERPEPWAMDDEHVDAFAAEHDAHTNHVTRRLLRSLDRAAGAR